MNTQHYTAGEGAAMRIFFNPEAIQHKSTEESREISTSPIPVRPKGNQCSGKKKYQTKDQAEFGLLIFNGSHKSLTTYECPHCHKWHVGHVIISA